MRSPTVMATTLFSVMVVVGGFLVLLNLVMVYVAFATLGRDDHRPTVLAEPQGNDSST